MFRIVCNIVLVVAFFVFLGQAVAVDINEANTINVVVSEKPPKVDSKIEDAEWNNAIKISAYFYDRFTGKQFPELTEIYLQQGPNNTLFLAFICHDPEPESIVANMSKDQSNLDNEDTFSIVLDPFHNHKDISWFSVNAAGAKAWNISGGTADKVEWAGQWQAAVLTDPEQRKNTKCWQGEMAIPLAALPHPADLALIGANFDRRWQRKNLFGDWQPVGRIGHSVHDVDFAKMGHLKGIILQKQKREVSLMPYIFLGEKEQDKEWKFIHREGLDAKVPITDTVTAVLSVMSDEENIEGDVASVEYDYTGKAYVGESRPFWRQGSSYRETYGAFYSTMVGRTHAGLSLFGKPTADTSTAWLTSFNKDEGTVNIASAGYNFTNNTGGGAVFVHHSGQDTGLLHYGMGTRIGWFSTGGNITILRNAAEDVWGERWLQHVTVNLRNLTVKTIPYYTSEDYLNPIGFERYIGVFGSRSYSWVDFKHAEDGFWGKLIKNSSVGIRNETGNYTDGAVFRRTYGANANISTRKDHYLDVMVNGGKYGKYNDGTLTINFKGNVSDPKRKYGLYIDTGRRAEELIFYISTYGSLHKWGLTSTLELAKKWHIEDERLIKLTFNYDFTKAMALYGRWIVRNEEINFYCGFRRAGYAGTEVHFIVGGPNRQKEQHTWIQHRVLLKVIKPLGFSI